MWQTTCLITHYIHHTHTHTHSEKEAITQWAQNQHRAKDWTIVKKLTEQQNTTGVSRLSRPLTDQSQSFIDQSKSKRDFWNVLVERKELTSPGGALATNAQSGISAADLLLMVWNEQSSGCLFEFCCCQAGEKNKQQPNNQMLENPHHHDNQEQQQHQTNTEHKEEGFLLVHCNKTLLPFATVSMATRMENRCDVCKKETKPLWGKLFKKLKEKSCLSVPITCVNKTLDHCSNRD